MNVLGKLMRGPQEATRTGEPPQRAEWIGVTLAEGLRLVLEWRGRPRSRA